MGISNKLPHEKCIEGPSGTPSGALLPMLIAHRGAMARTPENTTIAFDAALCCNVDGIECDVQLTADGIPVVFHDDDIFRITGQKGSISDYTFDMLVKLDYGKWFSEKYEGTPLLGLKELIRRYAHQTHLMIEFKTGYCGRSGFTEVRRNLAEKSVDMIMAKAPESCIDNIHILSFDQKALFIANERAPALKTILNLARDYHAQIDMMNNSHVISGYGIPFGHLDKTLVALAHNAGKKIMTYACNTTSQVAAALHAKADFILTDDPAAVAPYFYSVIYKEDRF